MMAWRLILGVCDFALFNSRVRHARSSRTSRLPSVCMGAYRTRRNQRPSANLAGTRRPAGRYWRTHPEATPGRHQPGAKSAESAAPGRRCRHACCPAERPKPTNSWLHLAGTRPAFDTDAGRSKRTRVRSSGSQPCSFAVAPGSRCKSASGNGSDWPDT